ncbi:MULTISPECIES: DUF4440 domain-containing protein [Legionella]|uniref:DUF4440 domain-containing protein n=1 Tax=Legionella resiliens TaxID=2905958 RepID=A0ABS8WWP4_9GAMM|nr:MULTISPECIES: DUF4440 domain-containing protein [unclassified Legionella]MCE0721736.1 DUF4440 domain-containing protein [Legionella sp. 9fVS26]MCE3530890.1 DUF4440 domain-containing protein [Legionella sp. 8cVS16]QLZ70453.1 hypothetical protein FOLKNPGA_03267 [Legionella sp. PC1000]
MELIVSQIINHEKQLLAKSDSVDILINLIDDEFIEYGSNGQIHDKNEAARWLSLEDYSEAKGMEFEAKFLTEDVVLLTYLSEMQQNHFSESKRARRISIWRRKNGSWRMVFHQGISIEK